MEIEYQNTLGQTWKPQKTLHARHREEIQEFLREAQRQNKTVHIISCGNNWGYGSAVPTDLKTAWLLDLSEMKRISHYNEELGSVRLEPGVTFYDLADFLNKQNAKHIAPIIGAGGTTSVIGNALERGFSITASGQRCENILSLEAVIPSGDLYQSFHRSTGLTSLCLSQKNNLGPQLDHLFLQSNFGVVTSMDVTLPKKIENPSFFVIRMQDQDFLKACRFAKFVLEKWEHKVGPIQLAKFDRVQASAAQSINHDFDWQMIGGVHADCDLAKIIAADLKKQGKRLSLDVRVISRHQVKKYQKFLPHFFHKTHQDLEQASVFLEALSGKPQESFLNLAIDPKYNSILEKYRSTLDSVGNKIDRHGLLWYAPMLPFTMAHLLNAKDLFFNMTQKFDHLDLSNFIFLDHRLVEVTLPLRFRKDVLSEVERANRCWDQLFLEGKKADLYPYRLPTSKMHLGMPSELNPLANAIKRFIDPQNILMPNKYNQRTKGVRTDFCPDLIDEHIRPSIQFDTFRYTTHRQ